MVFFTFQVVHHVIILTFKLVAVVRLRVCIRLLIHRLVIEERGSLFLGGRCSFTKIVETLVVIVSSLLAEKALVVMILEITASFFSSKFITFANSLTQIWRYKHVLKIGDQFSVNANVE